MTFVPVDLAVLEDPWELGSSFLAEAKDKFVETHSSDQCQRYDTSDLIGLVAKWPELLDYGEQRSMVWTSYSLEIKSVIYLFHLDGRSQVGGSNAMVFPTLSSYSQSQSEIPSRGMCGRQPSQINTSSTEPVVSNTDLRQITVPKGGSSNINM